MRVADSTGSGRPATVRATVDAWDGDRQLSRVDSLAAEEPLEIRLAGCSVAVTMRTPGDDFDLAAGFLLTEGIIRDWADIASISHCPSNDSADAGNIVNINPRNPEIVDPERWRRNFFATSSCGICGKASIAAIKQEAAPIDSRSTVESRTLYALDSKLRQAQDVFAQTGGLHAAGLFDSQGTLLAVREDVGRHNAVDKVIGQAVRSRKIPLHDHMLVVSSRGSFEIVQKALMAGIPMVAAVSAPSSLAVELARSTGMTLLGFLRSNGDGSGRFNVYAGAERITRNAGEQIR
jgi:FdhD protein